MFWLVTVVQVTLTVTLTCNECAVTVLNANITACVELYWYVDTNNIYYLSCLGCLLNSIYGFVLVFLYFVFTSHYYFIWHSKYIWTFTKSGILYPHVLQTAPCCHCCHCQNWALPPPTKFCPRQSHNDPGLIRGGSRVSQNFRKFWKQRKKSLPWRSRVERPLRLQVLTKHNLFYIWLNAEFLGITFVGQHQANKGKRHRLTAGVTAKAVWLFYIS